MINDKYVHQVKTGGLVHVQLTLLSAYSKNSDVLSVNWNTEVQLYEGISDPLANVVTLTCNVSPTTFPPLLVSSVEELLRNVPASVSQLIDAEIPAPGANIASGDLQ